MTGELQPRGTRQHHVQHDDIGPELLDEGGETNTVRRGPRVVAGVGEAVIDAGPEHCVVFDHQNPCRIRIHISLCAPHLRDR